MACNFILWAAKLNQSVETAFKKLKNFLRVLFRLKIKEKDRIYILERVFQESKQEKVNDRALIKKDFPMDQEDIH